uniref:Uncharacterized protein n=1 Tax=Oryza glumipatula TaxID=40148 RepID=A0A0E0A9D5_9ORYZ
MSERTSREGLQDGCGARTTKKNPTAEDDQCRQQGCRYAVDDEDDESDNAMTRRGDIGVARCQCSGENSTGGEATLRRAPLSIPTTSGGGPGTATLWPEGVTQRQAGNPKFDGADA